MRKAEPLKLQSAALIERGGKLTVEMVYGETPELDPNAIGLTLRLPVEQEFPVLPEAELEALRRVQSLAGDEIRRIEKIRGPAR